MISKILKLLALTTLLFILNAIFYLPESSRINDINVDVNYSKIEAPSSVKRINTPIVKKEGLKYILYWNEAYDSKGKQILI